MIKARIVTGDVGMLVLGLTEENVARLRQGEPIFTDIADLGVPKTRVLLVYGKDTPDLLALLRRFDASIPYMGEPAPGEVFRYERGRS